MLGLLLYKAERYEEAIAPLRVAVSRRSDAYEMLADAYAKEYFFSEALAALEKQKVALVKKKQETVSIDAGIDRMRRAVRLLDRAEWVEVIDSVRTNKADLLSAYNLIADNGRLEWVKGNQGEATSFVNGRGDHAIMTEKGEDGVYSLHGSVANGAMRSPSKNSIPDSMKTILRYGRMVLPCFLPVIDLME